MGLNGVDFIYYNNFSVVYDQLMNDIDYKAKTKKLLKLFEKYDRKPTLLLDLACGTGGFSFPMAENNIDVIGVDCSDGMLAVAESKRKNPQNPMFLCQNAEELDLFGTVDGAICMLDSLNHLPDYQSFCTAVAKVSLFLEPERLFIFDLNTPYKHRKVLDQNTFVREGENAYCVWQNNREGDCVDIYLDLFVKQQKTNMYERLSESFCETAYSLKKIEAALKKAGLEVVTVLDETGKQPQKDTERWLFVTRKKA